MKVNFISCVVPKILLILVIYGPVCKIHAIHLTILMTSSITYFYQGLIGESFNLMSHKVPKISVISVIYRPVYKIHTHQVTKLISWGSIFSKNNCNYILAIAQCNPSRNLLHAKYQQKSNEPILSSNIQESHQPKMIKNGQNL